VVAVFYGFMLHAVNRKEKKQQLKDEDLKDLHVR
jgi:hypothetical protein